MPSLGSLCARRARRSKYSWAVMPGVTGGRLVTTHAAAAAAAAASAAVGLGLSWRPGLWGLEARVERMCLHSPGLRMCGCVSCTGCPNWSCAAETEA